jgi:hypothetical protein
LQRRLHSPSGAPAAIKIDDGCSTQQNGISIYLLEEMSRSDNGGMKAYSNDLSGKMVESSKSKTKTARLLSGSLNTVKQMIKLKAEKGHLSTKIRPGQKSKLTHFKMWFISVRLSSVWLIDRIERKLN